MVEKLGPYVRFQDQQTYSDGCSGLLTMPSDWPEFSGHFPNLPVLPAVSIIDISIYLIQKSGFPMNYQKFAIEKSRFTGPVTPGLAVRLAARKVSEKAWSVEWTQESDGTALAQVQLSF